MPVWGNVHPESQFHVSSDQLLDPRNLQLDTTIGLLHMEHWREDYRDYTNPTCLIKAEGIHPVQLVAVTRLKIRLLISLVEMQCVQLEAGPYLPQELPDLIIGYLPSPAVEEKRSSSSSVDLPLQIQELKRQIRSLHTEVQKRNKHM